jgi:brefeldin A-resistance guanine nucleotide exchange factor 1
MAGEGEGGRRGALVGAELGELCRALRKACAASSRREGRAGNASLEAVRDDAHSARAELIECPSSPIAGTSRAFSAATASLASADAPSFVASAALSFLERCFRADALSLAAEPRSETATIAAESAQSAVDSIVACRLHCSEHSLDDALTYRVATCLHAACCGHSSSLLPASSFCAAARACYRIAHRTGRESHALQHCAEMCLADIVRSAARTRNATPELVSFTASVADIDRGEEVASLGLHLAHVMLESLPGERGYIDGSDEDVHRSFERLSKAACHVGSRCKASEPLSRASAVMQQLYLCRRHELKPELQAWLLGVLVPKAEGKGFSSTEQQRTALEAVVDLCRTPSFAPEIYANFDCDISSSNVLEDHILALLSRSAFPVSAQITPTHLLSMEGIVSIVYGISRRCSLLHQISPGRDMQQGVLKDPEEYTDFWSDSVTAIINRASSAEDAAVLLRRTKHLKRRLLSGADHFNRSQKHGLEFLQANNLLPTPLDPEAIAHFLRHTPNVNKTAAGALLGEPGEIEEGTLSAYVRQMDMRGMNLEQALRLFLSGFVLPGEAQKISRILEHFADAFVKQNPQEAADADSAYILSYSIIMLNTDLHSPKVKGKMTLEEFVRNNRGMNGGEDFPRELLENIYNSILKKEIRIEGDNNEQEACDALEMYWTDKERLARSQSRDTARLEQLGSDKATALVDADLLSALWGPAIASISVVFDHSGERHVLEHALNGFSTVAHAAREHHQHSILDSLVASLCRFAPLLSGSSASSLGADPKARMAAETAFSIAHRHGGAMRSGWINIVDSLFRFYSCKLLSASFPDDVEERESCSFDYEHLSSRTADVDGKNLQRQRSRSRGTLTTRSILRNLGNGVSAILSIDADPQLPESADAKTARVSAADASVQQQQRTSVSDVRIGVEDDEQLEQKNEEIDGGFNETDEEKNERLAASCVKRCKPGEVIADSWRLDTESLEELAAAAASISDPPSGRARENWATAFSIRVLGVLASVNPDRISIILNRLYPLLHLALNDTPRMNEATEAAAVHLVRVCRRVLPQLERNDDAAQRLTSTLDILIAPQPRAAQSMMDVLTDELCMLVRSARDKVNSWNSICRLLGVTAYRAAAVSQSGLETLQLTCYGNQSFNESAECGKAREVSLPENSFHPVLKACFAHASSPAVQIKHARTGVSLLQQVTETATCHEHWLEGVRMLKHVAEQVERDEVRSDAILALQRASLHGLQVRSAAEDMRDLLENELMAVAVELSSIKAADPMARKAVSTACKVAVHSLDSFRDASLLLSMWQTLTQNIETCLERNKSEELAESATESLKNVLNVMHAKGILEHSLSSAMSSSLTTCKQLTARLGNVFEEDRCSE